MTRKSALPIFVVYLMIFSYITGNKKVTPGYSNMSVASKSHSTNYYNTFITVSADTNASKSKLPVPGGKKKTIAVLEYELIVNHPYQYTSDDVLFLVHAERNNIPESEYAAERTQFFSKGRACLRASPLTKTYGYGIHANDNGKIALFGMETQEYQRFLEDENIKKVCAMRNKRKELEA